MVHESPHECPEIKIEDLNISARKKSLQHKVGKDMVRWDHLVSCLRVGLKTSLKTPFTRTEKVIDSTLHDSVDPRITKAQFCHDST
jgi:hypothetical protein